MLGKEYTQKHALEQHMRHHLEGEVELEFPSYGPPTGKRRRTQYHVQVTHPSLSPSPSLPPPPPPSLSLSLSPSQHMRHQLEGEVELEFPSYGPPTGKRRRTQYHVQVTRVPIIIQCNTVRGAPSGKHRRTQYDIIQVGAPTGKRRRTQYHVQVFMKHSRTSSP